MAPRCAQGEWPEHVHRYPGLQVEGEALLQAIYIVFITSVIPIIANFPIFV